MFTVSLIRGLLAVDRDSSHLINNFGAAYLQYHDIVYYTLADSAYVCAVITHEVLNCIRKLCSLLIFPTARPSTRVWTLLGRGVSLWGCGWLRIPTVCCSMFTCHSLRKVFSRFSLVIQEVRCVVVVRVISVVHELQRL